MIQLHTVHQSCKTCVFADYNWDPNAEPDQNKPRQTGCAAGKLAIFHAQSPANVVEAEDDEAEFCIVNNRKCQFFRDNRSEWAKQVPADQWADHARAEARMRIDVIIVVDDSGEGLPGLESTLECLKRQTLKANRVFVVNNSEVIRTGKLQQFLDKHAGDLNIYRTDIHVRVEGKCIHHLACVDEVYSKTNGHFYATFRPGFAIPEDFIASIDAAINDRLEQFVVLQPVDAALNGMVVQRGFHKAYDGNSPGYGYDDTIEVAEGQEPQPTMLYNISEKAAFFANIYKRPELSKKVVEVCQSLSRS